MSKITRVISVCVSVCPLSRSQFLTDFDEVWHRCLEAEAKEPFSWGHKSQSTTSRTDRRTDNLPWHNRALRSIAR